MTRHVLMTFLIAVLPASAGGTALAENLTIDLNDPANAGRTTWTVPAGTDVRVIGSRTPRTRQMSIQGARDATVQGGIWKPTRREHDGTIHTGNITGSVTITGATIDNSGVRGADGVVVNAGGTTRIPFVMTNSTITGIRGTQAGDHADGVQPQGAVGTFRMENVRIATDFQGLMLADQPDVAYGGKVGNISLTDVAISKLPGGEGGCRYPIVTGGDQTVRLRGVSVYAQPGCRGGSVLNVDGRARISGEVSYDTAPARVTGADGGRAPAAPVSASDTGWAETAIRNMAGRGLTPEQIEERFRRYGVQLGTGVVDATINGSLGGDTDLAAELLTALRDGNAYGLQTDLVDQGFVLASDLVDQYAPGVVDYVSGGECSPLVMEAVAGAASAISGWFSGGKATVVAQLAQQVQLMWANRCHAQQADMLASIREYERRNISSGTVNAVPGIDGMLGRTLPDLGGAGLLSPETQIRGTYERRYPDAFAPMSPDDLIRKDIQWADQEREAQLKSVEIQNRAVQEQVASLRRAREFAAAGREGPGLRAELQASNAIQGEQVAAINSLTAATVATQRAETEEKLHSRARITAANAAAEKFMSSLAKCDNCTISKPLFGN